MFVVLLSWIVQYGEKVLGIICPFGLVYAWIAFGDSDKDFCEQ